MSFSTKTSEFLDSLCPADRIDLVVVARRAIEADFCEHHTGGFVGFVWRGELFVVQYSNAVPTVFADGEV